MSDNRYFRQLLHFAKIGGMIALVFIAACDKIKLLGSSEKEDFRTGSVRYENGNYRVDTSFIRNDISKKALIAALESDELKDLKSKNEIPPVILDFLSRYSPKNKFTIANSNEDWCQGEITDFMINTTIKVVNPTTHDTISSNCKNKTLLPTRQLVAGSLGKNTLMLSYMQCGIVQTQVVTLFKFDTKKVTDFWFGTLNEKSRSKAQIMYRVKYKPMGGC